MNPVRITEYHAGLQSFFERVNRQWIEAMFGMEPVDEWVLTHPEQAILEGGGAILVAMLEEEPAGTVALRRLDTTTVEFTKMAVDPLFRNRGIGEALTYASFLKAAELGATQIRLYSNTLNAAAIRLYERTGFRHRPVENDIYKRANVKMEISTAEAVRRAGAWQQQQSIGY